MDSLGEVGKKMRSAIKAKLVELGNASSTGYIDDELPDYVMIMVANKRSKQQMLTDLNLFLGSNTDSFVTWLHQVLQKLQEVTLPSNLTTKAKKKIGESSKKDKKKDKKKAKEPSITDVIAVELMEKAKKTIDPKVKCEKKEKSETPTHESNSSPERSNSSNRNDDNDLDFPTITEIQKQTDNSSSSILHRKELASLGQTENQINVIKKKLTTLSNSEKSDRDDMSVSPDNNAQQKTSSVKSRLGVRPPVESNTAPTKSANIISLSAIRKSETEFLKKIVVKQKEDNERKVDDYRMSTGRNRTESNNRSRRDRRSSSRDRYRNNNRDRFRRKSRSRSPIKYEKSRPSIRQRIGERVNIVPATASTTNKHSKTPETDGNFKVKQRPALNSTITAHAGKSLLLRAMADARKSTQTTPESKKKTQRENIVVQVKNNKHQNDEEYVPESISGHSESEAEYHPSYKSQDTAEDDGDVIYLNNNDDAELDDLDDNTERSSPKILITVSNKDNKKEKSYSPVPPKVIKRKTPVKERIGNRNADRKNDEHRSTRKRVRQDEEMEVDECESQRTYNKVKKTRVSPIKFDLTDDEMDGKSRSSSRDRSDKKSSALKNDSDHNGEEHSKRIKLEASRSFDHVPALLSSVAVPVPDSLKPPVVKAKERCKFYPNCSNNNCIFYHPNVQCKAFPNCKFGESCAYFHPKCKFDLTCNRIDCSYSHTAVAPSSTPLVASSIVPAQNYKSITATPNMTICKFFPNCVNTNCLFQHPKVCKFGRSCANKYECNFFHFETASSKSKFKWVSSLS